MRLFRLFFFKQAKISKVHSASGEAATTSALGFINTGCGDVSAVELADWWF